MAERAVTRRHAAKQLLVGATGVAAVGSPLAVGSPVAADEPVPGKAESPPPSAMDAHVSDLLERYPSAHLTAEQIAEIRLAIERRRAQSAALRRYRADWDGQAGIVFAAYRRPD